MPRCGCSGTCDCDIQVGAGLHIEGRGNPANPYTVGLNLDSVVDRGLTWDDSGGNPTLSVKIAGDGLDFDPSGALTNTGGGGGGGNTGATVAKLEARTEDVIGGTCGYGYMVKPTDARRSYAYGVQQALDFLHVPVRFLSDGQPVVFFDEEFSYRTNITVAPPDSPRVEDQDGHRWSILPLRPCVFPWESKDDFTPATGWFGYLEENQYGLTFLADVFREVGNGAVLLLELRFPYLGQATEYPEVTQRRIERFLTTTRQLISLYGRKSSVIITTATPFIPGQPGEQIDVLKQFTDSGISAVGPMLTNNTTYPPADLPATWTWLFCWADMDRAALQSYVDTGKHTILFTVTRQYLRETLVNKPNGVGAKGVLSADPVYYAGNTDRNHPLSGFKYRKPRSTWLNSTVDHGLLPPNDQNINDCRSQRRGSHHSKSPAVFLGADMAMVGNSAYYVLHGWLGPLPDKNDWAADFTVHFDRLNAQGEPRNNQYLTVAFAAPTDHAFTDTDADEGGNTGNILDHGYVATLGMNGYCQLQGYDNGVKKVFGTSGVMNFNPGTTRMRVGVNKTADIWLAQVDANGNSLPDGAVISTDEFAKNGPRGGYAFLGRHAKGTQAEQAWTGEIGDVTYHEGGGSSLHPQVRR